MGNGPKSADAVGLDVIIMRLKCMEVKHYHIVGTDCTPSVPAMGRAGTRQGH